MRKNAVNRQLKEIDGGICAPSGFYAGGIVCFGDNVSRETKECLSLVMTDRRCPIACVYADVKNVGAPSRVTKKNVKSGFAKAIIVNSGRANVLGEKAEKDALSICRALAKKAKICPDEVVIASTGKVGERFPVEQIVENIPVLYETLSSEGSKLSADMLVGGREGRQFSYSFEIGDTLCKIGGIFKGEKRVCPNMATTLCFVTTDVAISPEILQKSLRYAVGETFNLLNIDDIPSPNDFVCILSSGKAGNYKIERIDGDYEKFTYALTQTLRSVCKRIAKGDEEEMSTLCCKVEGARSKLSARVIAKSVVTASGIKKGICDKSIAIEDILYILQTSSEEKTPEKAEIRFIGKGEVVLYEEGRSIPLSRDIIERVLEENTIEIIIKLAGGNYGATAIGRLK